MKKKYLFLYLKTGGGHLSPAKAVKQTLEERYPGLAEAELVDGLEGSMKPAQWVIEDGYRTSVNYAKWVFESLYAVNKIDFFGKLSNQMFVPVARKIIEDHIRQKQPDGIVIFHYFLIEPVYQSLEKLNLSIPVTVVVTDPYTAHPIWFTNKKPEFIVFSDKLKKYMLGKGLDAQQIFRFPQIINPSFETKFDGNQKIEIFEKFQLAPDRKTILIFGGGEGLKKGLSVLKNLAKTHFPINVIMVSGRNKILERAAHRIAERPSQARIKVFGFVDFMDKLLAISDIVVSKCGASALAEMLIMKKIPIVVDYIWEQEKGNVDFLLENKLGFYEPRPTQAVKRIEELLSNQWLFNGYRQHLENLDYKNGVYDVADFILSR
jgi:processive 1,2-diacylglycerol beta-glucosyltransferase/1,2-diacylglycerol 3-beta-galactosyltransferase